MTSQPFCALELDVDYGSGPVTARFEFMPAIEGRSTISEDIRTGYLVDGAGSTVNAIFTEFFGDGEAARKGVHVDFGGGQHVFDIDFQTPGDATKRDDSPYQWGTSADPSVGPNEQTATSAGQMQQQAVFMNALRLASPDSITPARFSYGEYSPDGFLDDHLDVAIESPSITYSNDQSHIADGTITLVETVDLNLPLDAQARRED